MRKVKTWKPGMARVGRGCFAYVQSGGLNVSNAGLIVGRDTALVVDALYVRSMTQAFKRAIKKTSTKPLRYIVCTHHHADHTLGLLWFPEEIPIIAHRFMKERMQETGLDLAHYREVNPEHKKELRGIRQRFPSLTFEGEVAFDLGGRRVELLHFGHAHSKGDIVVHVPDEGVVYTGDICFNFITPATFDANIGGWIHIAKKILKLPIKTIVPGHGPVGDRRALEETLGYLELVRRESRRRFQDGVSARRAARDIPLGTYAGWQKPDRVEQAVMKLYNEFRGRADKGISLHAARGG